MALYANGYKVAPVIMSVYAFENISGSPYDNTALAEALNSKLEDSDNVSRLTNDAGYLTLQTLPIWDGTVE